ncbi:uncharacterized protein DEA37_0005159 [Paragonimus westermani]|uniref:Coiled-coil domain-containing protein 104 n=1 Tax=Paragonimus westermani TaxID=34504 RepID=A0A5J4N8W6_9TREM|nr:uncharacterized protein DEA37_0005159 [Paragonimus westermani]
MTSEPSDFLSDPVVAAHVESFTDVHCSSKKINIKLISIHLTISFCSRWTRVLRSHRGLRELSTYGRFISEVYLTHIYTRPMQLRKLIDEFTGFDENALEDFVCRYPRLESYKTEYTWLQSLWNFDVFYRMMCRRNVELERVALSLLEKHMSFHARKQAGLIQPLATDAISDTVVEEQQHEINVTEHASPSQKSQPGAQMTQANFICTHASISKRHVMFTNNGALKDTNSGLITPLVATHSALGSPCETAGAHDLITLVGSADTEEPQTTSGNWFERQAFLRKQRDLLVQMRQRRREHILDLMTNNSGVTAITQPSDKFCTEDDEMQKVFEKRRALLRKLKAEVIDHSFK